MAERADSAGPGPAALVVRPARPGDVPALLRLAAEAGPGMTNMPASEAVLEERVESSARAFARTPGAEAAPLEETYLLVLEDRAREAVVGCSAVIAAVGLTRPFYSFQRLRFPHVSHELGRFETVEVLQLVNEFAGASELGMLFVTRSHRRDRNGAFLSRVRFLLLAEFPRRFSSTVFAELRGVCEAHGRSPFWEGLGRHFFDMDFTSADQLSARGRYQFIADLMPKHPVYVRLLPPATQAVIGEAHPHSRPALELLRREGFRAEGYVDVFDGGPTVHCPRSLVRTVRRSRARVVREIGASAEAETALAATTDLARFRAARGPVAVLDDEGGVRIPAALAEALGVEVGDRLRVVGE